MGPTWCQHGANMGRPLAVAQVTCHVPGQLRRARSIVGHRGNLRGQRLCSALSQCLIKNPPPILARLRREGIGRRRRAWLPSFPSFRAINANPIPSILQGRLHFPPSLSLDSKFLGAAEPRDAQLPSLSVSISAYPSNYLSLISCLSLSHSSSLPALSLSLARR